MLTRDVAAWSCANGVNTVNDTTLKSPATMTWTTARLPRSMKLRRRRSVSAASVRAPTSMVATRMLNGGTSSSAMRITGQVVPQPRLSITSMSRAVLSEDAAPRSAIRIFQRLSDSRAAAASQLRAERGDDDRAGRKRQEGGPGKAGEIPERAADDRYRHCECVADGEHAGRGAGHIAGRAQGGRQREDQHERHRGRDAEHERRSDDPGAVPQPHGGEGRERYRAEHQVGPHAPMHPVGDPQQGEGGQKLRAVEPAER